MREKLKERLFHRIRFKGTFDKYGLKTAYKGLRIITILLLDVKTIQGEEITDHLWFNLTKRFKALGLLYQGDVIAFDARVDSYVKGYVGRGEDNREIDYKLTYPTKIVLLEQVPRDEKYYTVCPRCDYPNTRYRMNLGICRRCGFNFNEDEASEAVDEFPRLEQTTLLKERF